MNVELEYAAGSDGSDKRKILLCSNGEWAGGMNGKFMAGVDDDFPVNNLFLLLEKGDNPDEHFLSELDSLAELEENHHIALILTDDNGEADTIPVRSVEYGERSVSFYRQSIHQTL